MPIPSNLKGVLCATPSGIDYIVLFDDYSEHYAANASQITAKVVIGWEDRDDFLLDAVGYSTWDFSSTSLNRTLPLQCPLDTDLWCDDAILTDKGMIPDSSNPSAATPTYDPTARNWPRFDWAEYQIRFLRPKWIVLNDANLATNWGNKEQFRYVTFSRRYVPRDRKKPGYTFQYPDPSTGNPVPIDEVGFTPDYSEELIVTWMQVPYAAIPFGTIRNALFSLNLTGFSPGISGLGVTTVPFFLPGTLAFKGMQQPVSWYLGADGNVYGDISYVFASKPGPGWNYYQTNSLNGAAPPDWIYEPITSRLTGAPPFKSTEFQALFIPASN